MLENTDIIRIILGVGGVIAAFKSIDWLISIKYKTKDDCESCRKTIFDIINKDRDLLSRVDTKVDIVLKIIQGGKDETKL